MFMVLQVYLQGDHSTIIKLVEEPLFAAELIDQCNTFLFSGGQDMAELERELLENAHNNIYINIIDGHLHYVDILVPKSLDLHHKLRKSLSVGVFHTSQEVTRQKSNISTTCLKKKCETSNVMPSLPAPLMPSAPSEGSYETAKNQGDSLTIAQDGLPISSHESQSVEAAAQCCESLKCKENNHLTLTDDEIHTSRDTDDKSPNNTSEQLEILPNMSVLDNGQNSRSKRMISDHVRNDEETDFQETSCTTLSPPKDTQGKKEEEPKAIQKSGTPTKNELERNECIVTREDNISSSHVCKADARASTFDSTKDREKTEKQSSPFLPIYGFTRKLFGNHDKGSRNNQKANIDLQSQNQGVIPFHGLSRGIFKRRSNSEGEQQPEMFLNKRKRH
ncbi:hypothetical protein AC249_AIPGENE24533 [Exaiptasia diaphana]|nr:hypothetical protein AC249_AIPGENE24533 [Exaiptasia diaphana]